MKKCLRAQLLSTCYHGVQLNNQRQQLTRVVPMVEGQHDNNVPEVVRVSQVVHFAVEEPLRDARNVEEERQADQEVHADHTRHQHLRGGGGQ